MQGEIDRALGLWEKALEIDPNNQKATDNIAKAKKIID
jgi:tetratricopeptide (TPR) repeat protein